VDEKNSRGGFFVGLLVGGVVGSVLTLWLADRVRRQLRERGIDVGGSLAEFSAIIREKADEFLVRAKEAVKQAVEEGREASSKARSDLEERFKKES